MNKNSWYIQIKPNALISHIVNLGHLKNTNRTEMLRNIVKYFLLSKNELINDNSRSIIKNQINANFIV